MSTEPPKPEDDTKPSGIRPVPQGLHRRAEDREELRSKQFAFQEFLARVKETNPAEAFFAALDVYRKELMATAVRRLGNGGLR